VLIGESRSGWSTGPIFAAFAEHFCHWLISYRAEIGVRPDEEAVLVLDNAQTDADPEAIRVFRANHVRVITLPPLCTHCLQPVDVAWAKSSKHRFSALVMSQTDWDVLGLLSMLIGEKVTEAPEAMKERVRFVSGSRPLTLIRRQPPGRHVSRRSERQAFTLSVPSLFSSGLMCASAMTIRRR
jgi:hypothetical protein